MKSEFDQNLIYVTDKEQQDLQKTNSNKVARTRRSRYRSEIGIISDMLTAISNSGRGGIAVSAIARIANVSYNSVNEKCQKLIDAGLISYKKGGKNNTFRITENGIEFLAQVLQFTETAKSMNIRY